MFLELFPLLLNGDLGFELNYDLQGNFLLVFLKWNPI